LLLLLLLLLLLMLCRAHQIQFRSDTHPVEIRIILV
jgi:hypothetical protein